MRRTAILAVVISLAAGAAPAQPGGTRKAVRTSGVLTRIHIGEELPDIVSEPGSWINAPDGVNLARLRGGPVLLVYTVLW